MALNNIIAPTDQIQNSQGRALAGGFVFLYQPGTTTFITSYTDSSLTQPNTNPVRLSGSGRANIWITQNCDLYIQDRNGNPVLQNLGANPEALGGGQDSGLVPNGSFEIDTDGNTIPDGWSLTSDPGSNNAIDTSESTDGGQSFRFTSTGSGGGALFTTDFFPVNGVDPLRVNFDILADVPGPRNIVRVEWYDVSFVSISNSDIYDSTATPLIWTEFQLEAIPPATARFAKLRLIGVDPSVVIAANVYFDRINVFYPNTAAGVFDNITIQDNEIISTNLNGVIELKPDGTGLIQGFWNAGAEIAFQQGDPAAGGLFVNNTLTGVGLERVLTASDAGGGGALPAGVLGNLPYITTAPSTYGASTGLTYAYTTGSPALTLTNSAATPTAWSVDVPAGLDSTRVTLTGDSLTLLDFELGDGILSSRSTNIHVPDPTNTDPSVILGGNSATFQANTVASTLDYYVNIRGGVFNDRAGLRIFPKASGIGAEIFTEGQTFSLGTFSNPTHTRILESSIANGLILGQTNSASMQISSSGFLLAKETIPGALSMRMRADGANNDAYYSVAGDTDGMAWRWDEGLAVGQFVQANNNGLAETKVWMTFIHDAAVELGHNDVKVARTASLANGGLEVNNTVTGAGFERVLTTSDGGLAAMVRNNNQMISGTVTISALADYSGLYWKSNTNAITLQVNENTTASLNGSFFIVSNEGSSGDITVTKGGGAIAFNVGATSPATVVVAPDETKMFLRYANNTMRVIDLT